MQTVCNSKPFHLIWHVNTLKLKLTGLQLKHSCRSFKSIVVVYRAKMLDIVSCPNIDGPDCMFLRELIPRFVRERQLQTK